MKSSLVILYHRQPYDEAIKDGKTVYVQKKSPNGIVPTLRSFFAYAEKGTWVAWKQIANNEQESFQERVDVQEEDSNYSVLRIPLNKKQVKNFYHITSKEAISPILHSFPYHFTYESSDWDNFKDVNRLFAEAACAEAADDALIWIHDYNLWLAPYFIRQIKPDAKIAFFHHTPFPSVDIFNILPWRKEIAESLLCCDVVGFHIPRYSENFVNVARSLLPIEVVETKKVEGHLCPTGTALAEPEMVTKVKYKGQTVRMDAFPVGTNPEYLLSVLKKPESEERYQQIKDELAGKKLIIAAGRVDYVKGNKEMLETFERLLKRRPELKGKVHFIVSCVSAATGMRIYEDAQNQIEQLAGQINGKHATLEWTPVLLFTKAFSFTDLLCYYKAADVCWTTPLRDGLNLVAKEYIVTHGGNDGTLILSEFVGAAVELPDAIRTNPYSSDLMDKAIDKALDMPAEEQKETMTKMYDIVTKYDVKYWGNRLLELFKNLSHDVDE